MTKDDDNSIGYNGEKKTALDLEIERELLEMMENEDPEPEKQKRFKIAGILSAFVIAILAIIRFINRTIYTTPNLKGLNFKLGVIFFKIAVKSL